MGEPSDEARHGHLGWLFHNPDTGTEWSRSHPIESGECDDAQDVRPATVTTLKDALLDAWTGRDEDRKDWAAHIRAFTAEIEAVRQRATAAEARAERLERAFEVYRNDETTWLFCGRHPIHDDPPWCDCDSMTGCKRALTALARPSPEATG